MLDGSGGKTHWRCWFYEKDWVGSIEWALCSARHSVGFALDPEYLYVDMGENGEVSAVKK